MITKHEGQTFSKKTFEVDDCIFINCVLNECDLIYSGGDAEIVGTRLENCRLHFRGMAQKTIQALQMLGMLKVGPLPVPMKVDATKAN